MDAGTLAFVVVIAACGSDDDGASSETTSEATATTGAGATATTGAETPATTSGEPIRIGVLQDKSGVVVCSAPGQAVDGLEAAVEAVNSGEFFWGDSVLSSGPEVFLGRPIELVFEDAQANPNQEFASDATPTVERS